VRQPSVLCFLSNQTISKRVARCDHILKSHLMAPPSSQDGVPAPFTHILLAIVTLLPLAVPVPTNINIVITAATTVLCGCLRSVKDEPPQDAMTKKAGHVP
jgi:hypothetical protein